MCFQLIKFIKILKNKDLILENSGAGLSVYRSLYDTINSENVKLDNLDSIKQEFSFKLKETDGWRPAISSKDFQRLLSNLTSLKIKSTNAGYTFLNNLKLKTAQKVAKPDSPAKWIEQCTCPESHSGQFCENCAYAYRREVVFGDSFARCVPCSCNNHSLTCDASSGKCSCIHQTTGENCEACKEGFYGDALTGTPNDCKPCPCPNDGPCAQIFNYQSNTADVVCLNCPPGTRGNLCDICEDGYHLVESSGTSIVCEKCQCSANIDENAIGNCDTSSGKCLRCVYNTTGDKCDKCLSSYWGNALTELKCHACECNSLGSVDSECNLDNGQCACKKNVAGRECNKCKETYFNLTSGEGCAECKCNPLGSTSLSCEQKTGKCSCRAGVAGAKCDECLPNHFGFSAEGCRKCECDPFGSVGLQCSEFGVCKCRENVAGGKCNECAENFFNFTMGCLRCDDCYNLVQSEVARLRAKISGLDKSLAKIIPETNSAESERKNRELQDKLNAVKAKVDDLHGELYQSDVLKPSYSESIKQVDEAILNINSELKKLQKPFDSAEIKLEEYVNVYNKLVKQLEDADLVLTPLSQSPEGYDRQLGELAENLKEELNKVDPKLLKLKNVASASRKAANSQESSAKNFSKMVNSYIREARTAVNDLNELGGKSSKLQGKQDMADYEAQSKNAVQLTKEAGELRNTLNGNIKEIEAAAKDLAKLDLSENSFDKEIQTASEKMNDISSYVSILGDFGFDLGLGFDEFFV